MELGEFIIRNKINVSDQAIRLCETAIDIIRRSRLPLYDERHVFAVFDNLDRFLNEGNQVKKNEIDFDVLLLAICWHDIWKSKKFPLHLSQWLPFYFFEGIGSMRIFKRAARAVGFEEKTTKAVTYAIRKHPGFQILPLKTLEAKILKDMDGLEEWSLARLKPLKEDYLFLGVMDLRPLRLIKFYFEHFMVNDRPSAFSFNWSRAEFKVRKKLFLGETRQVVAEFTKLLKK